MDFDRPRERSQTIYINFGECRHASYTASRVEFKVEWDLTYKTVKL
jgi:hypothetical protein